MKNSFTLVTLICILLLASSSLNVFAGESLTTPDMISPESIKYFAQNEPKDDSVTTDKIFTNDQEVVANSNDLYNGKFKYKLEFSTGLTNYMMLNFSKGYWVFPSVSIGGGIGIKMLQNRDDIFYPVFSELMFDLSGSYISCKAGYTIDTENASGGWFVSPSFTSKVRIGSKSQLIYGIGFEHQTLNLETNSDFGSGQTTIVQNSIFLIFGIAF